MSRFVCNCGYFISTTGEPNNTGGRFYGDQQLEEFFAQNQGMDIIDVEAWFIDNGKHGEYCPDCKKVTINYEMKDYKRRQ